MRMYDHLMKGFNALHERIYQTHKDRVNGKNDIIEEVAKLLFLESFRLHHDGALIFEHDGQKLNLKDVFTAAHVKANGAKAVAKIQSAFEHFKLHPDYVVTDDAGEQHAIFDKNAHLRLAQPGNYEAVLSLIQDLGPVTDNQGNVVKKQGTLADIAADVLGRANVGAAAIVASAPYAYVNTVSDLINIRPRRPGTGGSGRTIDSSYLVVFLNSPYGQSQLQRLSGGAIFDHVSLYAVPEVRIYEPSPLTQRYIGDKVRQAERLRERARVLDRVCTATLAKVLGESEESWVVRAGPTGLLPSGGFRTRVGAARLRGRLDSAGYHPELTAISDRAANAQRFVPLLELADLVTETRARTSAKSAPAAYISILHLLDGGYVDSAAAARHQPESDGRTCVPGDVLLSGINPAANRVAVCADQSGDIACSPEFSILQARPGVDPHYLAFALRSLVCLRQLVHLGQGTSSSRRRIDEAELPALWVPICPDQQRVGSWMSTRQACMAASSGLRLAAHASR